MIGGLTGWNRLAPRIALADPDAKLKLEIHFQTRAKRRQLLAIDDALAVRAAHFDAGGAHRGGTAVIGHRHVFVVGTQRRIRATALAAVLGVRDAREKIRERANFCGQVQRAR